MSGRQDRAATRERIMDTMLELARKTPLGQITVHDICLACGISRKTFYTYFPNKYDLLQEIFRQRMNRPLVNTANRLDKEIKEEYIERYLDWASFLKDNGAFIRSTYDTDQWCALERILLQSSLEIVTKQVERYLDGKVPMTSSVRRKLWLYVCGEQGLLLRWIVDRRKETAEEIVQTVLESVRFDLLKRYRDTGGRIEDDEGEYVAAISAYREKRRNNPAVIP